MSGQLIRNSHPRPSIRQSHTYTIQLHPLLCNLLFMLGLLSHELEVLHSQFIPAQFLQFVKVVIPSNRLFQDSTRRIIGSKHSKGSGDKAFYADGILFAVSVLFLGFVLLFQELGD